MPPPTKRERERERERERGRNFKDQGVRDGEDEKGEAGRRSPPPTPTTVVHRRTFGAHHQRQEGTKERERAVEGPKQGTSNRAVLRAQSEFDLTSLSKIDMD
ncbi:hypothetical protein U1Q18_039977 [Sarracenia purpurea var. burkii]